MRSILALDLATATGWAAVRDGRIESGVQHFDLKRGESAGMRFIRFNAWLAEVLDALRPELVVYEQAHHRGGAATELAVGLVTRVLEATAARGIDPAPVHSSTLKKHATGSGTAKKPAMIARATALYPDVAVVDDNHADALLLLRYALDVFVPSHTGGPTR